MVTDGTEMTSAKRNEMRIDLDKNP